MADDTIPRRKFLLGAGTAVAASLAADAEAQTPAPAPTPAPANAPMTYLTLSALEVEFVSAVAGTMIPADALSPSGTDCGVVVFIDRQLAGSFGGGAKPTASMSIATSATWSSRGRSWISRKGRRPC